MLVRPLCVLLLAASATGCGATDDAPSSPVTVAATPPAADDAASAAGASKTPDPGPGVTIAMKKAKFQPRTVRVYAGETVTWRNDSKVNHRIKGRGMTGAPLSAVIAPGQTFEWTAPQAGTMKYICTLRLMAGKVQVQRLRKTS